MSYLKELSFLIIESSTKSRNRLREALQNCVYKANIDQANNLANGLEMLTLTKYDAVFAYCDEGKEELIKFISVVKGASNTANLPLIVKLSTDKQDSTFIAELLLGGALGFICEPFSTSQLEKLLTLLSQLKGSELKVNDSEETINLQAASLLIAGAMQCIDEIAYYQATDSAMGGYAVKNLKRVSDMLKNIVNKIDQSAYENILVEKFVDVPPPKRQVNKKSRKKAERIIHPGEIINEIIASRNLSIEKLCSIGGIDQNILDNVCQKKAAITKEIADGLARAIGRSAKEWLALQKKFDLANANKNTDMTAHK